MSAVVASRDALAEALDAAWRDGGANKPNSLVIQGLADTLLASGAVVAADSLADDARAMAAVWGGDSMWITTGSKQADLMAEWIQSALTERGDQ